MRVRGRRECQECGERWSYYDSGDVNCPECGSLHSVGIDDPTLHTASAREFDLTDARGMIDAQPLWDIASEASEETREYVQGKGFVKAGELQPLDETYLAAQELLFVSNAVERAMSLTDDEEEFFLSLLQDADTGGRPDPENVPDTMCAPVGLAIAEAVDEYRRGISNYLDETPPEISRLLETVDDLVSRVQALDGDVPAKSAERLAEAARNLGMGVADDDREKLRTANEQLQSLT